MGGHIPLRIDSDADWYVYYEDLYAEFDGSNQGAVARLLRDAERWANSPLHKIPKEMFSEFYKETGHSLGTVDGEICMVLDRLGIPHEIHGGD